MIVLDSFALGDANIQEENGEKSQAAKFIDAEISFITPFSLAETYLFIQNSMSTQRAEAVLELVLQNKSIKVADDRDPAIIRDAVRFREEYGVHISVAFCAALAKKLDCPVLTIDKQFDDLAKDGICRIKTY